MKTVNYYKEYEKYIINNEPIPYKDLLIYPVRWRDAYDFLSSYDILDIDKDGTGNVDIISMSYLNFVLTLIQEETMLNKNVWGNKFVNILNICLRIDVNELKISKDDRYNRYSLIYKDIIITDRDFDKIRKIILYQNIVDYDDTYIDPEVKDAIDRYYKIKNKNIEPPTLERIKGILISSGISNKELLDMTYRDVVISQGVIMDKVEYITNKLLMPHCDSKKTPELEHWVFKKHKNKLEEAFVDADAFTKSVAQVT